MNKKVSELDLTKARLRLLEQSVVSTSSSKTENSSSKNQDHSDHHPTTTTTKSENHRVHFDLNNATTNSTEIRKPARTSRPNGRTNNVHLPSDARQKLEQLVSICIR